MVEGRLMPTIRIKVGDFVLGDEEKKAINDVILSQHVSEGDRVYQFEKEFAQLIGTKFSVAVNSGTSALISGLLALLYAGRINKESCVLTSPLTYVATSNSIINANLNPVYVDVDPKTFLITPENLQRHLEEVDDVSKYSLILPVHLMGYACDMDRINRIANKYGLLVFEDSAQAHGTIYQGRKTGSLSIMGAFSFYIAHNIQAGELGAVVCEDKEIYRLLRKIKANGRMCDCIVCRRNELKCPRKNFGEAEEDIDPRFTHDVIGYNFKTMEFQAALALCQLKKVNWIITQRRKNVKILNELLSNLSDILQLPEYNENVSYLAYPLVIKDPSKIKRKKLRQALENYGIESRPLFSCIPTQQPAYFDFHQKYAGKLPIAEYLGQNGFYIGCHQYLTQDDLEYVGKSFKKILRNVGV